MNEVGQRELPGARERRPQAGALDEDNRHRHSEEGKPEERREHVEVEQRRNRREDEEADQEGRNERSCRPAASSTAPMYDAVNRGVPTQRITVCCETV